MNPQPPDLVAIFKTADSAKLPFVKSLLDAAEIPYSIQGDLALGLLPLGPLATGLSQNLMLATVHVPRNREQDAREALRVLDEGD